MPTAFRKTGLGLHIAKNIVEALWGSHWCKGELKKGSEFFFTLPTEERQNERR
jgi:signal transduction histidine kinase